MKNTLPLPAWDPASNGMALIWNLDMWNWHLQCWPWCACPKTPPLQDQMASHRTARCPGSSHWDSRIGPHNEQSWKAKKLLFSTHSHSLNMKWDNLPKTRRIFNQQHLRCLVVIPQILAHQSWILAVLVASAPHSMSPRLHRTSWISHQQHDPHAGETAGGRRNLLEYSKRDYHVGIYMSIYMMNDICNCWRNSWAPSREVHFGTTMGGREPAWNWLSIKSV